MNWDHVVWTEWGPRLDLRHPSHISNPKEIEKLLVELWESHSSGDYDEHPLKGQIEAYMKAAVQELDA